MGKLVDEIKNLIISHEPPEVAEKAIKLLEELTARTDLKAFGIKNPAYYAAALAWLCHYEEKLSETIKRYDPDGKTSTVQVLCSKIRHVLGLKPKVAPGIYGHRLVRYGGDKLAWPIPRELVERWGLKPKTPVEWEITGEREVKLKFKLPFPPFVG